MEAKFQALLPPLKRFRLLQHRQQQEQEQEQQQQQHVVDQHRLEEEYKENLPIISLQQLPAKKRRSQSRSTSSLTLLHPTPTPTPTTFTTTSTSTTTTTTTTTCCCLPTKKRIRAFQPDYFSVSGKPLLPLDLNVEYKPSFNEVEDLECIDKNKKTPFAIGANQCEIAQTCDKINPKENPFGDNPHQSISTEKQEEEEEEKQNPFTGADVQSTKITEQAEAEDDGILCAICQSTDGDPSDPIVFCDGCDLMVHSTCYGNPLAKGIPEGDWFCSRCLISSLQEQKMPISCCLCPSKNGALKPTKNESWAHIVCALFVPEVFFEDPDGREGIDCSRVPNRRWGGKCYLCRSRKGCVVECSESKCPLAFHVTCALDGDLCIEYQEGKNKRETIVAGFCKSHTELWRKQQKTGKFKIVAREECKK